MPQTLEDMLANDYVTQTALKKIDHGLKKPRPGDFTIVRQLQKDLLEEQDSIHGGNRAEKAKKWASPNLVLGTSDLYAEMAFSDGTVTAVRDEVVDETSDYKLVGDKVFTERFYSSRVTYHINLADMLSSLGETEPRVWTHTAAFLAANPAELFRYIEKHGAEALLDKWLPAERHDRGYSLSWDVESVSQPSDNMVEVVVSVRERHLEEGVNA